MICSVLSNQVNPLGESAERLQEIKTSAVKYFVDHINNDAKFR